MNVGIGELARDLGIDPTVIRRAVKAGLMSRNEDGTFNLAVARKEYAGNLNHDYGHNAGAGSAERRRREMDEMASSAATPDIPERPQKGSEYVKAKTATQIYDARLKKLRYEERAKKLAPVCDIEAARFQEMRIIRDACLNIPSRISAQLAAETNEHKVFHMLENEIIEAFAAYAEGREIKEAS